MTKKEQKRKRFYYSRWKSSNYGLRYIAKEFERINGRCPYCNVKMYISPASEQPRSNACTIDHIIPISQGGGYKDENNLMLICSSCNNIKEMVENGRLKDYTLRVLFRYLTSI